MDEFGLGRPDRPMLTAWDELALAVGASPFLRPGWVLSWMSVFSRDTNLVLATVRRDGVLVAALPLLRRGGALHSVANAETPVVDVLATDGTAARCLLAGTLGQDFRRLDLTYLPASGPAASLIRDVAPPLRRSLLWRAVRRQPYVDVTGRWEDYEARHLGGDRRRELRRSWRRLAETGSVAVEMSEGYDAALLQEGFRVEARGWKARAGTAILSKQRTAAFYSSAARWAGDGGLLRLHFLRLDGWPIAFCLALHQHSTSYALKMGYDEDYARFAPGFLLLHRMLHEAFHEPGADRIELLGEDEKYKMALAHGVTEQLRVQVFHGGMTSRVDRMAIDAGRGARHILRERLSESTRLWLRSSASSAHAAMRRYSRR